MKKQLSSMCQDAAYNIRQMYRDSIEKPRHALMRA